MTLWQMSEISGEDDDLFGLGGARGFAPGERGDDIMLGGAVAFGKTMATGAKGGLSAKWEGKHHAIISRIRSFRNLGE